MAAPGYTINNLMGGSQGNISTAMTVVSSQVLRVKQPATLMKRFYTWELDFGQSGPPNATDCSVQWVYQHATNATAGTWSTVTPLPTAGYLTAGNIDVSVLTGQANNTTTAETLSAATQFYSKAINQRGAGFWQAAPGGEIYHPATASVGPLLGAYSATYNTTVIARLNWSEI